MLRFWFVSLLALSLAPLLVAPVAAQTAPDSAEEKAQPVEVDFTADTLNYDNEVDVVVARGNVVMTRGDARLNADEVTWNRKSGQVNAKGNVRVKSADGSVAYGDAIELTDSLKDGVVENMLIILSDGGRLAANRATRVGDMTRIERGTYTPCRVVDDAGCAKEPVWKITAVEVVHDPVANRVRYKNAQLEVFGLPIMRLPKFSHIADNQGGSGLLLPDIQLSRSNGLEIAQPYYLLLDRNRDLTLTPHLFTNANPAIEARFRSLTRKGAFQIGSYLTYGTSVAANTVGAVGQNGFRGYLEGSGKFQLTPEWSVRGSLRLASDRTFLRRYDISRDDRLRSMFEIERVTPDSYLSIQGWGFQTLRPLERQGLVPIALPIIDFRKRLEDVAGGRVELQLNSLAVARTGGQDTQRAFASARWDLRRIIGNGQEVVLTGLMRGDIYHTDHSLATPTALYRGIDGWNGRGIAAAALEIRWPLIGPALGGVQRLTPRVQFVASPETRNLQVPNEDSRAIELDDSNIFSLNRFPGYDRWEDGARITYGLDWSLDKPGLSINTTVGQSYRLSSKPTLFPDGTGLTDRWSDFVGRTTVKYRNFVNITHHFRLDKNKLAIRRNELDATIGSESTYASVGYVRLKRNIGPILEDLKDSEEIRAGGRVQISKFWALFGSAIVDLTGKNDDPTTVNNGFSPIRHRLGIAYDNDCLNFSFTWKRDYDTSGDAQRGNSFIIRLSFRNLGR